MPFGEKCEFENFAACVERMTGSVDDPAAYCSALMRRTEAACRKAAELDEVKAAFDAGVARFIEEQKAGKDAKIKKIVEGFDWEKYHANVKAELGDAVGLIVETQGARAADEAGGKFKPSDPFVRSHMTGYVGDRIVQLDDFTKEAVSTLIRNVLDSGEEITPNELGDKIGDLVSEQFDGFADWRADRIARTETAIAYNTGTAFGYKQSGVKEVVIVDGDDDEECRAVDGTTQTLDWFLANPIAHPNCERDGSPVIPGEEE
jgi:hypothetical protein